MQDSLDQYLEEWGERLGLYRGSDFVRLPIPERKPILGPWLVEASLTMLYAERGLGKSMLLMAMGMAVAKGESFLNYSATQPASVLYVDGEMSPRLLMERLSFLAGGEVPQNFFTVSFPHAFDPWIDLNDQYGRLQMDEVIRQTKPKVVILDNKSTLMPPNRENDAESWVEIQRWLIDLRKRGIAVVLVHHAGKGGKQRGTSMSEVVLDTVINLSKPAQPQGTQFVMSYEKTRHFYGDDAKPKLITLDDQGGYPNWQVSNAESVSLRIQQARELASGGMSQRQVAHELGVSVGTVNAALKAA